MKKRQSNPYYVFMAAGFELMAAVFVGIYFGGIIDKKYGTNGLGMLGVMFLLIAAWLAKFIVQVRRVNDQLQAQEDPTLTPDNENRSPKDTLH